MSDPYTDPDFATAALVTIDTQRDVLDGGPLEIAELAPARDLTLDCATEVNHQLASALEKVGGGRSGPPPGQQGAAVTGS